MDRFMFLDNHLPKITNQTDRQWSKKPRNDEARVQKTASNQILCQIHIDKKHDGT